MTRSVVLVALAVALALAGCAGREPGRLATDEEACQRSGGVFHFGLCERCL